MVVIGRKYVLLQQVSQYVWFGSRYFADKQVWFGFHAHVQKLGLDFMRMRRGIQINFSIDFILIGYKPALFLSI